MYIFWNVHAGQWFDEPTLLRQWADWQPSSVLVMDNAGFARRLQQMRPDAIVIYRQFPDGNVQELGDPGAYIADTAARVDDKRVYIHVGNECHATPGFVGWTVAAINEAKRRGLRLCVLNTAVGNPQPDDWKGMLRPVLEAMQGTEHILGLHEYFDHFDPFCAGWDPTAGDYWHIGRYHFMREACAKMELTPPPIIITEHGADSHRHSEYKGWRQGMSEDEYADALIRMDREVYRPDGILGQLIFSYGDSGQGLWQHFDVQGSQILFERLAEAASDEQPTETEGENDMSEEWRTDRVRATGAVGTNVRPFPSLSNAPAGTVGRQWLDVEVKAGTVARADGYDWARLRGDVNGWVARSLVEFASETTTLGDPPPDTSETDATIVDLQQQVTLLTEWMATEIASDRHALEALQSVLDNIMALCVALGKVVEHYAGIDTSE